MTVDIHDIVSELTDTVYELICPLELHMESLAEQLGLDGCITDELDNVIEWKLQELIDDGKISLGS